MTRKLLAASALAALLLAAAIPTTTAQVFVLDDRAAALKGADRLLEIQFANGAFPWIVGQPGEFQNVQGITAIALLDAFKLSLDQRYLAGAQRNRDWLEDYHTNTTPPRLLSAPNVYFLAEYALFSGKLEDLTLARSVLDQRLAGFGGPEGVVDTLVAARKAQGHTNLGLWDASLYVRAAQDVGYTAEAEAMAVRLVSQTIVDPYAASANWYEIGLAGIVLALTEADFLGFQPDLAKASAALRATQAADGSFPVTFGGVAYAGDVQVTAYAAMALVAMGSPTAALRAADFLRGVQFANGGFPVAPGATLEIGEVDAEAIAALVAAAVPVPNGAVSYADAARGILPPGTPFEPDLPSIVPGRFPL